MTFIVGMWFGGSLGMLAGLVLHAVFSEDKAAAKPSPQHPDHAPWR